MTPLPVAENVLKYEVLGTYDGTNWANIFHANFVGSDNVSDLHALLVQLDTFYDTEFMPLQKNSSSHLSSVLTDLTSDTSPRVTSTPAVVGSITGPGLAANAAVGLSWPILRRYRGGHPRTYLPGVGQDVLVNAHQLQPASITAYQAAAEAFLTDVNAADSGTITQCNLGSLSYHVGGAVRTVPVFDKFVGGAIVHSRLDTQRRRLGKETT
jgi:hypothetical protein